ncbi:PLDc N-terminal domain-containing protein [Daejeonella oryzae]|uniref:PLDc N-terminal domain-containing protein n=1 Tax=Daejeonella oryzae TaxID=1122943 RepID=UPI0003F4B665|nr:PLDc N-terminal domain-containing protein [Daejeonella oryzae]
MNYIALGTSEIFILVFVALPLILSIYCLIEILRSKGMDAMYKSIWILIVLLAPLLGSLLYLAWGKNQKNYLT